MDSTRPVTVIRERQLFGRAAKIGLMSTDDGFDSAYRVFAEALAMLASSPEDQCEAMGDFNVAWELKDDVQAGRYLVDSGHLSAEQQAWILALVSALDAVPAATLPAGAGRDQNLDAMRHPSWIPLRVFASEVRNALASKRAANAIALDVK